MILIVIGSSWLWIEKSDCKNELRSECSRATSPIKYDYLDGSISGDIFQTEVSFLSQNKELITSPSTSIISVTSKSNLISSKILGLSKSTDLKSGDDSSVPEYPNFLESLKMNKIIEEIAFSFYKIPRKKKSVRPLNINIRTPKGMRW